MTKREEIRAGVEGILGVLYNFHLDGDAYAKQIIQYLHSQGVAIVRCPKGGESLTGRAIIVAVESLVEETKEVKFVCPHSTTTVLDDRVYCVDCGEEVIRDDD